MKEKNRNHAIFAVSLALIAVMVLLIAGFLSNSSHSEEGIILPVQQQETVGETETLPASDYGFVEINTDNVLHALRSMSYPQYYHQTYSVSVGSERSTSYQIVDIWYSNGLVHAEVKRGDSVKSLLTDGQSAWIWYDADLKPVNYLLDQKITLEDLIGMPALDYLQTLEQSVIVDTEYLVLEDGTPCIFVCTQENNRVSRYWISLDNGLMYRADLLEDSVQEYTISQTGFDRLAPGDQMFHGRFCLPDGSEPFMIKREMPQP